MALPTALPTILPDQSLLSLPIIGQAMRDFSMQPGGIAILVILIMWGGMWLLVRVARRQ